MSSDPHDVRIVRSGDHVTVLDGRRAGCPAVRRAGRRLVDELDVDDVVVIHVGPCGEWCGELVDGRCSSVVRGDELGDHSIEVIADVPSGDGGAILTLRKRDGDDVGRPAWPW